jgi:hypothetical protein
LKVTEAKLPDAAVPRLDDVRTARLASALEANRSAAEMIGVGLHAAMEGRAPVPDGAKIVRRRSPSRCQTLE